MKPDQLAISHSQTTDKQLAKLRVVFSAVKREVEQESKNLLQQLLIDKDGVCVNCKENKKIVNQALALTRVKLNKARPMIKAIYGEGVSEIELIAHEYVNWLRNG